MASRISWSPHLRLAAKIARGYRGCGLPIFEVVSEGNVDLMRAVKRFKPDKEFRLSNDAIKWIKASIKVHLGSVVAREDRHHGEPEAAVLQFA
jgi:DNA-directed RNA polymerase sigma subunit (sigma70/sigma32)